MQKVGGATCKIADDGTVVCNFDASPRSRQVHARKGLPAGCSIDPLTGRWSCPGHPMDGQLASTSSKHADPETSQGWMVDRGVTVPTHAVTVGAREMKNPTDCPTDIKLTSMPQHQLEKCMNWDDWRIMTTFQIFAAGVAQTAGLAPSSQALPAGMDAVFQWWCKHGMPLGNEPDVADVAAQLAVEIASLIYEPDDIQDAISTLEATWKSTPCAAHVPARILRKPRSPITKADLEQTMTRRRRSAHRNARPSALARTAEDDGSRESPPPSPTPPTGPWIENCVKQKIAGGMSVPQAYADCRTQLEKPSSPAPAAASPETELQDPMKKFFRDMESRKPKQGLAERLLRDFR